MFNPEACTMVRWSDMDPADVPGSFGACIRAENRYVPGHAAVATIVDPRDGARVGAFVILPDGTEYVVARSRA